MPDDDPARPPVQTTLWADLIHLHRTTSADLLLAHHAELPADLAHLLRPCDHRILDTLTATEQLHLPPAVCGS